MAGALGLCFVALDMCVGMSAGTEGEDRLRCVESSGEATEDGRIRPKMLLS